MIALAWCGPAGSLSELPLSRSRDPVTLLSLSSSLHLTSRFLRSFVTFHVVSLPACAARDPALHQPIPARNLSSLLSACAFRTLRSCIPTQSRFQIIPKTDIASQHNFPWRTGTQRKVALQGASTQPPTYIYHVYPRGSSSTPQARAHHSSRPTKGSRPPAAVEATRPLRIGAGRAQWCDVIPIQPWISYCT